MESSAVCHVALDRQLSPRAHAQTFNMAPERGSGVPSHPPLKLSPRRTRAVSGGDRCGGPSRAGWLRSLARWSKDPTVLMLITVVFLVSPGVVFVAKAPFGRHHHEGRRRPSLRSQPIRREQYPVVRTVAPVENEFNTSISVQQQHERGGEAGTTTPPRQALPPTTATENGMERHGEDEFSGGENVASISKERRQLRSRLPAKDIDASSHHDKEIEVRLAWAYIHKDAPI